MTPKRGRGPKEAQREVWEFIIPYRRRNPPVRWPCRGKPPRRRSARPGAMIFAEYVTTLATALTIFNVYSTTSVSAPTGMSNGGGGMLSFRSARRWRRRTITSSARIYLTMAVPYVAATVLVNRIDAEEVVPIYIAAVASVSGRFNKGRHTVLEWIFKTARTMIILGVIFLFMLFQGISQDARLDTDRLYDMPIAPRHVLLCMFSSWRWFIIAFIGLIAAPLEQKKTNVALAVLKITLVWLLLEKSGKTVVPGAWGVFDAVIVTSTPLRNTVYVLYSFLIFSDAAESVAVSVASTKQLSNSSRRSGESSSEGEDDPEQFDGLSILRMHETIEVLTFEEFYERSSDAMVHFVATIWPRSIWPKRSDEQRRDEELEVPPEKDADEDTPQESEPDIENGIPPRPG